MAEDFEDIADIFQRTQAAVDLRTETALKAL
jgi:hypothetical protein